MRHRGVHVGDLLPRGEEGGREFTADDEEISWCCSPRRPRTPSPTPARTATSGGRGPTSRPWWRPSPVGVVVFDAGTGRPASLNREARWLVDGLNAPGRPPEELLEALTCRFSDGREIALAELPMKEVISAAGQRHADPRRRRRRRVDAADLDQGVDGDGAAHLSGPRPGRSATVFPHHRRAGRSHGRPHRRPPRRGAHRLGHAVG